jgi:cell division septum initiation protein DivIVA
MYIVYEEHIEQLEEENEDLKQEIVLLRQRLKYFRAIEDKEDLNN